MNIIVENKIPGLAELLEQIPGAAVSSLPADSITADAVAGADALFVRTRTRCDESLLKGSKVKFIGTATIGTDHIDTAWCEANGITVANAPGCNAPAVAQWVFAAAENILGRLDKDLTIGIVGVGHVGSIVSRYARFLGMRVLLCDPPLDLPLTLEQIAPHCDILTFHTPLTDTGAHPTRHIFDKHIGSLLRPGTLVMNAARGAVTDTYALLDPSIRVAVDCWEGEPDIDLNLLAKADVATPHIAGYSAEGKRRATLAVANAYRSFLGLGPLNESVRPAVREIDHGMASESYDIMADTAALKAAPGDFEKLRNTYILRHEI